jgi:hypothetical protein
MIEKIIQDLLEIVEAPHAHCFYTADDATRPEFYCDAEQYSNGDYSQHELIQKASVLLIELKKY